MIRNPYIMLVAVVFLTGCSLVTDGENYTDLRTPRYCLINNTLDGGNPSSIRAVSYNIKFSKKADLAGELLRDHQDLCQADIIFLQEMDREGVMAIAGMLGANYIYYPAVRHPLSDKDFGNAIVTRWPIVYDQKIILPHLDPDDLQRVVVGAGIRIGGQTVMAYSIHMSIWLHPYQREDQLTTLMDNIPDGFDAVIIGGDFNTFTKYNRKTVFDVLTRSGFELATPSVRWTYKHWYLFNKKSLVDYIFARNLDTISGGMVKNRRASDHVPIWSELKFKDVQVVTSQP